MRKIRVGLVTNVIDNRQARGTALVARRFLEELSAYKEDFDITLIHGQKTNDPIYEEWTEVLMPKSPLPIAKHMTQEIFFWLRERFHRRTYDVIHYLQPRVWPSYLLAPGKRVLVTAFEAGIMLNLYPRTAADHLFRFTNRFLNFRMHRVIASSEAGRREILETYNLPEKRVVSIPLGVGKEFKTVKLNEENRTHLSQTYGIQQPYLLSVNRLDPHKNIVRLIEAFAKIAPVLPDLSLVLVGGRHMPDYSAEVDRLIESLNLTTRVHIAPYVSADDLPLVYSAAEAMAYPSLHEGFGLPILESMACGTPVTCGNKTSSPEIAGDAAVLFDPYDVAAIEKALFSVLTIEELRTSLVEKGYERVNHYTWSKMAKQITDLYTEISPQRTSVS